MGTINVLEDQILNEMGQKISDEIDFEILCGMLCQMGWSKVVLSPMTWEDGHAVDEWTAQNIKGHFETMGLVWIFEKSEDANWFSLRWMG